MRYFHAIQFVFDLNKYMTDIKTTNICDTEKKILQFIHLLILLVFLVMIYKVLEHETLLLKLFFLLRIRTRTEEILVKVL